MLVEVVLADANLYYLTGSQGHSNGTEFVCAITAAHLA